MRAKFPHKKRRKRLGCGPGSGHGKTSTKGHKGHKARSGYSRRPGFEGGQNPLYRRLPKRGFNNAAFRRSWVIMNIGKIEKLGWSEVSPDHLIQNGSNASVGKGLRVLGDGELTRPVTVKAHYFTESAKIKIEKAGGQAVLIPIPGKSSDGETSKE
jgi:large subunit ribosomal protein L15